MTDREKDRCQDHDRAQAKRPYGPPTLVTLGRLADVTQGGKGGGDDFPGSGGNVSG